MPEPASRMINWPSTRSSTQEVLPPKKTVLGPGVGMDPRTPQNFTFVARSVALVGTSSAVVSRADSAGLAGAGGPMTSNPASASRSVENSIGFTK